MVSWRFDPRSNRKIHISGWIFEATEQYNISFFVSGGFLMLAGIISCVVDLLKRKRDRWESERLSRCWQVPGWEISKCLQVAERSSRGSGQLKRFQLPVDTRVHQDASDQWTIWSSRYINVVQWGPGWGAGPKGLTLVSWSSSWATPVCTYSVLWNSSAEEKTKPVPLKYVSLGNNTKIYDRLWHVWCLTLTRKVGKDSVQNELERESISTYIFDNICLICISIYIHLGLI